MSQNIVDILYLWGFLNKKYKFCHQSLRKRSKKRWNFVMSPRGKINFRAPIWYRTHFFRQTEVFGSSGIKSERLWQWALERFEWYPLPPPSPSSPTIRVLHWIGKLSCFSIFSNIKKVIVLKWICFFICSICLLVWCNKAEWQTSLRSISWKLYFTANISHLNIQYWPHYHWFFFGKNEKKISQKINGIKTKNENNAKTAAFLFKNCGRI